MKNILAGLGSSILYLPLFVSVFLLDYSKVFEIPQRFWGVFLFYLIFSVIVVSTKLKKKDFLKDLVWYFIFFFGLLIVGLSLIHFMSFEHNEELRATGRLAFLFFSIALCISPIINLLNYRFSTQLIFLRKISWTLAFLMVVVHLVQYINIESYYMPFDSEYTLAGYIINNMITWYYDALIWTIAGIIMIILGVTSNNFSQKLLGSWWKKIHYLAYPAFLVTMLHIAFAGAFNLFYAGSFAIVTTLRFIDYTNRISQPQSTGKTTKYICVVCWYIYDENVWDPDGWIPAGTKFEDIPDDRVCPVCWVTKKDFVPLQETEESNFYEAKIRQNNFLTDNVVEFIVETEKKLNFKPGQFARLIFQDFDWEFIRQYSIAENQDNKFTFLIKLKQDGRAGKLIPKLQNQNNLKIQGVFGDFVLQETNNPKYFIATWTGLAPIYQMIINTSENIYKKLYFCVRYEKDLFYQEKLEKISNLEIKYYISREQKEWYNSGHLDLSTENFPSNAEFYICWNPNMVQEKVDYLKKAGYQNIYFEKFE